MDTSPLVSVVIPTRNRAGLLKRSIASVLAQTHRNLELVVVNDASTDHTRDVLAAIPDPRLKVVHREQNRGAAAARNAGIAITTGKYVSFQDDDDFWLVQKLEKQVAALEGCGKTWCIASYIRLGGRGPQYIGGPWYWRQLDYRLGIGEDGPDWSLIATPGWLVRRDLLLGVGAFDERIRSWDDWELGLRLTKASGGHVAVDEPLWIQDWVQGQGLTRAEKVRANDLRIVLEKHGDLWTLSRKVQAQHWYVIGRIESLHHEAPAAGRVELMRSLRLNPFRAMTWAALAMSWLGTRRAMAITQRLRAIREPFKS